MGDVLMSKVILSEKELMALPDEDPKKLKRRLKKKVVLSEKELLALPDEGPEKEPGILSDVAYIAEGIDRVTGAPVRAAIGAAQEGQNPLSAAFDQFGEPSHLAPTGKQIVEKAGVSDEPIVGDYSPADILGTATDFLADPGMAASAAFKTAGMAAKAIKPVRIAIKNRAATSAFKSLAQLSTNTKLKEVFAKNRPQIVGRMLLDEDLAPFLNKPDKLLEKINGKQKVTYVPKKIRGKMVDVPQKAREGGLISEISGDTESILKGIKDKTEDINVTELMREISEQDIRLRMDPETASKFDGREIDRYNKILKKYLKPIGDTASDTRNVMELQNLKKSLGSKLRTSEFFAPTDKTLALEKNAMMDVYHSLKRKIEGMVDGIPVQVGDDVIDAGVLIGHNNQRITSLMDVGSMLENIPAAELKGPTTAQKIIDVLVSGGAGLAVGAATQSPTAGLMTAGTAGAIRSGNTLAKKIPGAEAQVLEKFINPSLGKKDLIEPGVSAVRQLRDADQEGGRSPQSIGMKANYMLLDTEIPRSTDYIMEHPNLFVGKVMQTAGPEWASKFQMSIDKNDIRTMQTTLPIFAQQFPQVFENDEYNMFDGKIIDPNDRQRYAESVYNSTDINDFQKAEILNHLNKTNEVLK